MTNRDKDMINAMSLIKKYCDESDECLNCPMYDNCSNHSFPHFWYIPEV